MAITTVVKTIGTTGTFSTVQLWEDGAPANLTTSNRWSAGTFVGTFQQGEAVTGVGITGGTFLDSDGSTYIVFGTTTTPAAGITVTGTTSLATCVLSGAADVGVIWQGQCQNQEFVVAGPIVTLLGSTTSATAYKDLTTVAGASFQDNANARTNALRYNASNGAAFRSTTDGDAAVVSTENNSHISKLQITTTGVSSQAVAGFTAGLTHTYKDLICEGTYTGTSGVGGVVRINAGTYSNLIIIQRASGATMIVATGVDSPGIYNCTFVASDDLAVAPTEIFNSGLSGNPVVQNCGLFAGDSTKAIKAGSATYTFTTCYSDISGTTGVTQTTYGNEFQNVLDATRDFRLKAGAAQIDTGTTDSTHSPADISGLARPQGAAYDVGVWELLGTPPLQYLNFDWPYPRGYVPATELKTFIAQGGQRNFVNKDTFFTGMGRGPNYDYPNPRGFVPGISLKTHIDQKRNQLIGKDTLFGTFGQVPDFDYPNPRGYVPAITLKTHIDQKKNLLLRQDTFFGAAGQILNYDYPNPKTATPSIILRTHLDQKKNLLTGLDTFFGLAGNPTFDWPVPKGATPGASLKTHLDLVKQLLIGQDKLPNRWIEFPNPGIPKRANDLLTWLDWFDETILLGVPFFQLDWPVPKSNIPGVTLKTWVDPLKLNLQGQDKFFGLAGNVNYDWPVPKGSLPGITLKTHIDAVKQLLIGQDKLPFLQHDYPNPGVSRRSLELLSILQGVVEELELSPLAPFLNLDFVNPKGSIFPRDILSVLQTFPGLTTVETTAVVDWLIRNRRRRR